MLLEYWFSSSCTCMFSTRPSPSENTSEVPHFHHNINNLKWPIAICEFTPVDPHGPAMVLASSYGYSGFSTRWFKPGHLLSETGSSGQINVGFVLQTFAVWFLCWALSCSLCILSFTNINLEIALTNPCSPCYYLLMALWRLQKLKTSWNPPVLGPPAVKTAKDRWKPLLWQSCCPVKKHLCMFSSHIGSIHVQHKRLLVHTKVIHHQMLYRNIHFSILNSGAWMSVY